MRFDATLCPHCRTSATPEEISFRIASYDEQVASGLKAKGERLILRSWIILVSLILLGVLIAIGSKTPGEQGYTVPTTVKEAANDPLRTLFDAALAARSTCYEAGNADCAVEEAVVAEMQEKWETLVDAEFRAIDSKIDCIAKRTGTSNDISVILSARKKCGITDPQNFEEQLRKQRERLSK